MAWIEPVTYETASNEVKTIIDQRGSEILKSNKVATLLKNAVVYDSVEINGWRMDAELQRLVSKRMGDLLEYTISKANNSYICTNYFTITDMAVVITADNYFETILDLR